MRSSIMFSELRAEMARKKITIKQLADKVGVNRDTMGGKLSGKRPLYLHEAFIIQRAFFKNKDVIKLFRELYDDQQKEVS